MSPLAEHTRVERWTSEGRPFLEEYRGNGRLEGKAAIVTGGDSGIVRSVSVFFAREGRMLRWFICRSRRRSESVRCGRETGLTEGVVRRWRRSSSSKGGGRRSCSQETPGTKSLGRKSSSSTPRRSSSSVSLAPPYSFASDADKRLQTSSSTRLRSRFSAKTWPRST